MRLQENIMKFLPFLFLGFCLSVFLTSCLDLKGKTFNEPENETENTPRQSRSGENSHENPLNTTFSISNNLNIDASNAHNFTVSGFCTENNQVV